MITNEMTFLKAKRNLMKDHHMNFVKIYYNHLQLTPFLGT